MQQTHANILRFVELRRAGHDAGPQVQIIEIAPTAAEMEEFTKLWSIPGVDKVNVKAFDSWGDQVQEISALRAESKPAPAARFHCPNLWYHAHIYWDGTLVRCDRDYDAAIRWATWRGRDAGLAGQAMAACGDRHVPTSWPR